MDEAAVDVVEGAQGLDSDLDDQADGLRPLGP